MSKVLVQIRRECAMPSPRFYASGPWWECPDCGAHARAEFLSGAMTEELKHRDVTEWVSLAAALAAVLRAEVER